MDFHPPDWRSWDLVGRFFFLCGFPWRPRWMSHWPGIQCIWQMHVLNCKINRKVHIFSCPQTAQLVSLSVCLSVVRSIWHNLLLDLTDNRAILETCDNMTSPTNLPTYIPTQLPTLCVSTSNSGVGSVFQKVTEHHTWSIFSESHGYEYIKNDDFWRQIRKCPKSYKGRPPIKNVFFWTLPEKWGGGPWPNFLYLFFLPS